MKSYLCANLLFTCMDYETVEKLFGLDEIDDWDSDVRRDTLELVINHSVLCFVLIFLGIISYLTGFMETSAFLLIGSVAYLSIVVFYLCASVIFYKYISKRIPDKYSIGWYLDRSSYSTFILISGLTVIGLVVIYQLLFMFPDNSINLFSYLYSGVLFIAILYMWYTNKHNIPRMSE